jgi:capsular exopolysaccharide synthesis family protein
MEVATVQSDREYQVFKDLMNNPEAKDALALEVEADSTGSQNDSLSHIHQAMADKQAELDQLKILASKDHPNVKRLEDQLASLKTTEAQFENRLVIAHLNQLRHITEMNHGKLNDLRTAFAAERDQVQNTSEQQASYTQLQADYYQTRKLVEQLDERIKEINVDQNAGALNITVVEVARANPQSIWPNPQKILITALISGLAIGVALAVLWDMADVRIRRPDELAEILRLPVFGMVPIMVGRKQGPITYGQYVRSFPRSPVAEAFRSIRTMTLMTLSRRKVRLILVTSSIPGEGKTTTVSNLGIAMAQADCNTLILDADLRLSNQHKIFEVENKIGLSSVLQNQATAAEAIVATSIPNLKILPAGPSPANPSELLNGEALRRLLSQLSEEYDCILIDSPPIVPIADARILASICDVTILIVRLNRSPRKAVLNTMDILNSVGARLSGAIVTGLSAGNRYGYRSQDYYYSYYSSHSN